MFLCYLPLRTWVGAAAAALALGFLTPVPCAAADGPAPDDAVLQFGPYVQEFNDGTAQAFAAAQPAVQALDEAQAAGAPVREALKPVLLPTCDLAFFATFLPIPLTLPVGPGNLTGLGCAQ